MLSEADWDHRYQQQGRWTAPIRRYLYQNAGVAGMGRILEVGCGSGVILADLASQTRAHLFGVDLLLPPLLFAQKNKPGAAFSNADGLHLPFAAGTFNCCICHFLLLLTPDPLAVLGEMRRVVRRGSPVIALAEPDYGGRIDFPPALAEIGQAQAQALRRQGADPMVGRKLRGLFHQTGFTRVSSGLLGGEWLNPPTAAEWQGEWQILANDLAGQIQQEKLAALKSLDQEAWQNGERILFVPTFYALGIAP